VRTDRRTATQGLDVLCMQKYRHWHFIGVREEGCCLDVWRGYERLQNCVGMCLVVCADLSISVYATARLGRWYLHIIYKLRHV
jgi:hypothetical protein